ncbi:MAG TPA: hypothetical protein VJ910_14235 [Desulfuromonadales bacterium]|nr:hypothetical protein [Desulfuromonadales bacterium]
MDIKKALLNPTSVFARPEDVLAEASLSRDQKIQILRRWEYDARELEVADDENMGGGSPDVLDRVLDALRRLDAEADIEKTPPTKQGGG